MLWNIKIKISFFIVKKVFYSRLYCHFLINLMHPCWIKLIFFFFLNGSISNYESVFQCKTLWFTQLPTVQFSQMCLNITFKLSHCNLFRCKHVCFVYAHYRVHFILKIKPGAISIELLLNMELCVNYFFVIIFPIITQKLSNEGE